MKTLITRIKRLALALCLATPIVSWAAYTTIGYEDFGDTAGVVLWRGATDSANFHQSTAVNVAADGTEGDPATLNWNEFCSTKGAYSAPGKLLVYDATGYRASSNADFGPLSLGGLWVKALASEAEVSESTPYSVTGSGSRYTDFGAAGYSTYFNFEKSFTIDRSNDIRCYGNVTIDVASGATFRNTTALWIENNSTVALTGEGTVELTNGLRMNASSTLDLSAATRPTINGDVTFPAGATLVVPASTEPTTESPFTVCSGTLTVSGDIYVKVGDAEAALATVTVDGGAITGFEFPTTEATFDGTTDWPTAVPFGYTYTFVGGATAESAVAVPTGVAVSGTLKTTGYITLTGLEVKTGGTLEVVDGNTTATAATNGYGDKLITGNVIVRAGATLTPTQTDFLDYYNATASTVDVYGTFALGSHRISIKPSPGISFNLYPGAVVSGVGDGTAALDLYNVNSKINVYAGDNGGEVNIEGLVKTQNANTPIWVAANTTLKLNGGMKGGVNKSGNGTIQVTGTIAEAKNSTVSEGTIAFVDTTVALPLTVNAGKTVTASASEGVTVPLNVTSMAADANITISGAGTVNGTVAFAGKPTGTLTGLTSSTWKGTVSLPAIAAGNTSTQVPLQSYGNAESSLAIAGISGNTWLANGSATVNAAVTVDGDVGFQNGKSGATYTFTKIAGGTGDLTFAPWSSATTVNYAITTLDADNYTGTINVSDSRLSFTIGNILKAGAQPGDKLVGFSNDGANVNVSSTTLNGEAADLEVKEDGIYIVVPVTMVTVTIPDVANTTVTVTADGEPVVGENGSYEVPEGSEVVATYAAAAGYEMTGTATYTIDSAEEGSTVTPSITTKQYVAYVVFQVEQGELYTDVTNYYTTVAAAIEAAKALKKTVVLVAQPDVGDTYEIVAGETINVKKGDFTFDGIIFPTGAQYNNTTSVTAGVTTYKCTVNTVTVQYPGQDPVGMTGQLIQILGGLYQNYLPAYVGTVVTVLDGSDATVGDAMPTVFTYDSEAHTYTLKTMVASYNNGYNTVYYPTLAYAVDTVTADGTITLLENVNEAIVNNNDKAFAIDLNGKIWSSDSDVLTTTAGTITINATNGGTMTTEAEQCCAVWSKGGNVVINGGTFVSKDYEEATVYVSTATGTVTINGGTFQNTDTRPYRWKTSWNALTLNVHNTNCTLSQIVVYGGTFYGNNPANGDDNLGGTFLAEGYQSTETSTGVWTVTEKQGIDPADPTSTQEVTPSAEEIADAGSAEAAAKAKATVTVPEAVATATGVTEETYKSYFTLSATETSPGSGVYEVAVVGLNEAVVFPTSEAAQETADLADVLDADAGDGIEITTAKPGLYYSIEAANSVDFATGKVEGERELATTTTVSPAKPAKTGTAVFYRVKVSVTAE